MKRVIIGALSGLGPVYESRRKLCRMTWIPILREMGYPIYFLLPRGTAPDFDPADCISLDVPDGYLELPQRTRAFCQWALRRNDWDYLFKNDDDSYIAPHRWVKFLETMTGSYVGVEWCAQMFYHSGGAGYFLDREAAAIIADVMTELVGAEDLLVGQHLNQRGIPTTYQADYREGFWFQHRRPEKRNKLVVAHGKWLTVPLWMDSHFQMMQEAKKGESDRK